MSLQHSELFVPEHVAIIMDGNTRWAKARGVPIVAGHKKGAGVAKEIAIAAKKMGIRFMTLYAFSTENWSRPQSWIDELMGLLRYYLQHEVKHFIKEKIRIKFIGDLSKISQDIQDLARSCEEKTSGFQGFQLNIALNYGARDEMLRAVKKIAQSVKNGTLNENEIDEKTFNDHLDTAEIPDPDLLIRTSGEMRISNYLLWQMAYSEFIFTNTLWPDYTVDEFMSGIGEFLKRERRFGSQCAAA